MSVGLGLSSRATGRGTPAEIGGESMRRDGEWHRPQAVSPPAHSRVGVARVSKSQESFGQVVKPRGRSRQGNEGHNEDDAAELTWLHPPLIVSVPE